MKTNQYLQRALRFSRYLQRQLDSDPQLPATLAATLYRPWDERQMEQVLSGAAVTDEAELKRVLRRLRHQVMARLLVRDLNNLADLTEVMATTTMLMEVCIRFALMRIDTWMTGQYGEPAGNGAPQDLLVIAMDRLGACELGFSSDAELALVYPEDGATRGASGVGNHEYFKMLGERLVAALNDVTADGFVSRVELGLRVQGDDGPLVASFAMLEDYLVRQSGNRERCAWIKARVISGDREDELFQIISPFVYRKYLDFGAIASLREMHAQILQQQACHGLAINLKLGPGGIREIEFIAQVFQLIRGGQDIGLTTRPTLATLNRLAQRGLLPNEVVANLKQAYLFLRRLEQRIQYMDDAHTHSLPQHPEDQALIAKSMDCSDYPALLAALETHRMRVAECFETILGGAPHSERQVHDLAPLWNSPLSATEACAALEKYGFRDAAETWRYLVQLKQGARYQQLPASSKQRFDNMVAPLLKVAAGFPNPDQTLVRVLNLLDVVSRRETYLALLTEYPATLAQVARLCSASAWTAEYLARHPVLLDDLLDTRVLYSKPEYTERRQTRRPAKNMLLDETETRMDRLRHLKHSRQFRLVAQDLAGMHSIEELGAHLSDLAEMILGEVLDSAWDELGLKRRAKPRFAIIGYGKLGAKELSYGSDLDLVFVYQDSAKDAATIYGCLAQRIVAWLTTFTAAGVLYDTDLRLRPDGASGLVVSSFAAFADYQTHKAWPWEHQALTRARCVAGDRCIGRKFERIRMETLTQRRELPTLRRDIVAMRQKMLDGHSNATGLFDLKHDRGGIVDVEFMVQYLVLAFAHRHPELAQNIGSLALLKAAGEHRLIPEDLAEQVGCAYRNYRRWQHDLRLQDESHARVEFAQAAESIYAVQTLWEVLFTQAGAAELPTRRPTPLRESASPKSTRRIPANNRQETRRESSMRKSSPR